MRIGDEFNPQGLFIGSFLPNCLLKYRELSATAKLCWARLAQYNGKNNKCYPSQKILAEELGISRQHLNNILKELEDKKFIHRIPPDPTTLQRTTFYKFLWHECFEERYGDSQEHLTPLSRTLDNPCQEHLTQRGSFNNISNNSKELLRSQTNNSSEPIEPILVNKTPVKRMFDFFLSLWKNSHTGACLFTGADAKQAQAIWRQCNADNPANPWSEFELRTKKITQEHLIDNFRQLIMWWNSAKKKTREKKSIYDTP